ncbi:MAG: TlyA family RNA methyltransferase [Parvibaculales bacterium]
MSKLRLDHFLVEKGYCRSRAQAQKLILEGHVRVNGEIARKPALRCPPDTILELSSPNASYVSRGGEKLAHGLAFSGFSATGATALDLGASTGGFTDVLLRNGAHHVVAIDVGHGQLSPVLTSDARVTNLEKCNARHLRQADLPPGCRPDALVCDVSFISLTLALPPAMSLLQKGAWMIALIKPQFEVGKKALGKSGVVKDPDLHDMVCRKMTEFVDSRADWCVTGLTASPILGPKGNQEFLLAARKG